MERVQNRHLGDRRPGGRANVVPSAGVLLVVVLRATRMSVPAIFSPLQRPSVFGKCDPEAVQEERYQLLIALVAHMCLRCYGLHVIESQPRSIYLSLLQLCNPFCNNIFQSSPHIPYAFCCYILLVPILLVCREGDSSHCAFRDWFKSVGAARCM